MLSYKTVLVEYPFGSTLRNKSRQIEEALNSYVQHGWVLDRIVSDLDGGMREGTILILRMDSPVAFELP